MANSIAIKLEDPPVSKRGRHAGSGALQSYISELREKHNGKWACLAKSKKNIAYMYVLRKQHEDLEITTRKNPDGTYGVWVKVGN
jgi:hypothetical protein